jgi:AcrR family transcriptional regulator
LKTLTPQFRRDISVEDKIINATVKCFQRFGINKTSMDDIAKAAKVSRPTIYRYFPSRHHLAVEVLVREIRDHTRLLGPVFKEYKYPPQAMVEGILFAVSTAQEHPYTSIVVSDAGSELLAKVAGSDQALLDAMSEQWLPSLNRWREEGYIRPGVRLDDLLLWITFYMHNTLGKADFMAISPERMRRMLETLLVPAVFDMAKLKKDFPNAS